MRSKIRDFNLFVTSSMVFSLISSASIIACILIGTDEATNKVLRLVFPIVFWLGLIAEQVFIWKANSLRKHFEATGKKRGIKMNPGIISILQTEAGAIADIVFAISLVVFVILMATGVGEKAIQYIFIFLLVLSFRLHCILNGKNFRYKKFLAKRKVDKDEQVET